MCFFCRIIFKALHRLTEHDIPVQCPLKERERERERHFSDSWHSVVRAELQVTARVKSVTLTNFKTTRQVQCIISTI